LPALLQFVLEKACFVVVLSAQASDVAERAALGDLPVSPLELVDPPECIEEEEEIPLWSRDAFQTVVVPPSEIPGQPFRGHRQITVPYQQARVRFLGRLTT
jgi:hypothetical protein